jgi:hypothetical protein
VNAPLPIVLRCADALVPKARYVFDTLFMARGIPVVYMPEPPADGVWVLYARSGESGQARDRCLAIAHAPESWGLFSEGDDVSAATDVDGLVAVLATKSAEFDPETDIAFDVVANAFYFLSSWAERVGAERGQPRRMHADSVFARLRVPQDIVDQYLERITARLLARCERSGRVPWVSNEWPQGRRFALVLSHDVDFVPTDLADTLKQGVKTVFRHLVRQRDPADAARAAAGLLRALRDGGDAYGCIPEIIAKERELGVRSSFQVAVGHRHPSDVNYYIEDDRVRDYLRVIPDSGFDLCLHGSYRSTENPAWYSEEVVLLASRLGRPRGSRQHFLAFDYDALFAAQERSGIRFDMSMGYADRPGARAGFSYPYFPYCLGEDRPYDVVEISLFLMDVTLRAYMGLKGARAREVIVSAVDDLRQKRGCASAVWHPIVFGGARDPGYDRLFWDLVKYVQRADGLATDGATMDEFWRARACQYTSFAGCVGRPAPTR